MSENIKIVCGNCKGKGLFIRDEYFKQIPEGVGIFCQKCEGKGYQLGEVFKERVLLNNIESVIPMVALPEFSISYQEFLEGKRPEITMIK